MGGHPLGLELTEAAEGNLAACNAVTILGWTGARKATPSVGGNPLGLELTEGDRAACAAVGGIEKSARGCNAAPSEDGGRKSIHATSDRSRSEPGNQYSDVQLSVTAPRLGRRVRDDTCQGLGLTLNRYYLNAVRGPRARLKLKFGSTQ